MFFGFFLENGQINEQVPSIFRQLSTYDRNRIFITQFNAVVDDELKINIKTLNKNEDLAYIFNNKINSLIQEEKDTSCKLSKSLIDAFLQKQTQNLHVTFKTPSHPAAKLIQMIWCKENKGIYFESSWLFCNYVHDKISRCHFDKQITFKDGLIVVSKDGEDLIAVMPCFKYVSMDKPHLADEEIKKAYKILREKNIEKFYIAFPKHDAFRRHIVVKQNNNEINSKLTLIPYAISHKIVYNNHSKNKNFN